MPNTMFTTSGMFYPYGAALVYDVTTFGAKGNGIKDDTTDIADARLALHNAGGGIAYYPGPGPYLTGPQPLYPNVLDVGTGNTVIKLLNGANADLFSAQTNLINLGAAFGTGPIGTLYNYGFMNLILDGNKANQTGGPSYCIRAYGYAPTFQNVRIRNGYSGGWLNDWNGGSNSPGNDSFEGQIINLKIHDCNGINYAFGGPHDSQFANFESFLSGSHCAYLGPNCVGTQFTNTHFWGPAIGNSSLALLCEASSISFSNSLAEGSDNLQVAALSDGFKWHGGRIFAAGNYACSGVKIGQQAGETPYNGQVLISGGLTTAQAPQQIRIETDFYRCEGPHGTIWFDNDGGENHLSYDTTQFAGSAFTGTPESTTLHIAHVTGLTPDGSMGKGGTFILPINAFSAFVMRNDSGQDSFNVNTNSGGGRLQLPNNAIFQMYSDAYSTLKLQLNPDGNGSIQLGNASNLYSGSGAPSSGLGSNGDYYFRSDTPGSANQRIYVKSGGSWSGII